MPAGRRYINRIDLDRNLPLFEIDTIREHSLEAEERAVPGHWDGDLMAGSRNTHMATLVERSSRFVMLVRVGGKDIESVVTALGAQVRRLPMTIMATLT